MFGRVKLDNTLLTCDQDNFNQITAQSRNRTLVTVVRDMYTTTVPPALPVIQFIQGRNTTLFSTRLSFRKDNQLPIRSVGHQGNRSRGNETEKNSFLLLMQLI